MLPTQILGSSGLDVTRLGFGSMGLRGPRTWGVRTASEEQAERVLHAVLDSGINFIDTSPDYGIAEQRIGRYLASRRGEFKLATKCGCSPVQHQDHLEVLHTWTADTIKRNIEESLSRLQTDFIDLLQFHGGQHEELEQAGLIDVLQDYRARGIVGSLGISTKLPAASEHIASGVFDVIQLPFSCLANEHADVIDQAAASGMGVIVRGGIAQGGPEAEIQREQLNAVWSRAGLDEVLPSGMLPAEMILRYTLSISSCTTTIVGTANLQHLTQNVAAAERGPLSTKLFTEINRRIAQLGAD